MVGIILNFRIIQFVDDNQWCNSPISPSGILNKIVIKAGCSSQVFGCRHYSHNPNVSEVEELGAFEIYVDCYEDDVLPHRLEVELGKNNES